MKTHQLGFFYRHRESVTEDELDLICKTLSLACIQPSVAPLLVLLTIGVTICGFLTQLYECQHHHLICKVMTATDAKPHTRISIILYWQIYFSLLETLMSLSGTGNAAVSHRHS